MIVRCLYPCQCENPECYSRCGGWWNTEDPKPCTYDPLETEDERQAACMDLIAEIQAGLWSA